MRKILNQFVLWGAIFAIASLCHAQDATYQTKVYNDNGGDRLCVNSGGSITVYSGGDLDLKSGASLYYNATKILGATTYLPIANGGSGTNTAAGAASAFGVGTEDSPTFTGVTATTGSTTNHITTTGTVTTLNVVTTFKINNVDTTKAIAFTDNQGSKMDSGTLTVTTGSQTVTTSLTTCELVFVTISAAGSHSVNYEALGSGTTFTLQGWLSGTEGTKYVGTASGYWTAIDQ